MTDVNPVFTRQDLTDRQKVAELFGSAPDVVLKAVGEFIKRGPGSLDHHNLRIIATAAPHIADPVLVAELIDSLAVTQMHVAARPIDLAADRAKFAKILPRYLPRTRQRLVADLVDKTTIDFLTFCPPERMTEPARAVMHSHLLDLARGESQDQAAAVASPYVSTEVVDAVLDRIEARIIRSERGTTNRAPSRLPLELVHGSLIQILDRATTVTDAAHVERAWALAKRCEPDTDSMLPVLEAMCTSSKLSERAAHGVLDEMRMATAGARHNEYGLQSNTADWFRSYMVSVPEMPRSVVRRAIDEGLMESIIRTGKTKIVDWRLYAYRTSRALPGSSEQKARPLSSRELDRLIARLPLEELNSQTIEQMTDPRGLMALGRRAASLQSHVFEVVQMNPHTPRELFVDVLTKGASKWKTLRPFREEPIQDCECYAICDPRLTDDEIAHFLARYSKRLGANRFCGAAVSNPSAGPMVFDYMKDNMPKEHLIELLAMHSTHPEVHVKLAQLADEISDSADSVGMSERDPVVAWNSRDVAYRIRLMLAENGTVHDSVVPDLRAEGSHGVQISSSGHDHSLVDSYGPVDVAHRIAADGADGVASGPHFDELMRNLWRGEPDIVDGVLSLADAGLLQEHDWQDATNVADRHVAMMFAAHPDCPTVGSLLETKAASLLGSTVETFTGGVELPQRQPRSWADLPDAKDTPFKLPDAARFIDGRVVGGHELTVVKSPRELDEAARHMGNCLSGFEKSVSEGSQMVATASDGDEMYAVAWRIEDGRNIHVDQINSRFNRRNVPDGFRSGVQDLTDKLRAGALEPVEQPLTEQPLTEQSHVDELSAERAIVEQPVDDQAEPLVTQQSVEPSAVEPQRPAVGDPRRPTRRRPLVLDAGSTPQTEDERPNAPYLLGRDAEQRDTVADPAAEMPLVDPIVETPVADQSHDTRHLEM